MQKANVTVTFKASFDQVESMRAVVLREYRRIVLDQRARWLDMAEYEKVDSNSHAIQCQLAARALDLMLPEMDKIK